MSETKFPTNKINMKGKKSKNLTRNWDLNKKKLEKPHQEEREKIRTRRNGSHKNLTRKRYLTKKAYKMPPGKEISQKMERLTRKRVSKTARQRRMLMKLGFKSIFCFFVNTKKQIMLPDNFYWWYIFYRYLFIHLTFYLHHKSILFANIQEEMTSAVIYLLISAFHSPLAE